MAKRRVGIVFGGGGTVGMAYHAGVTRALVLEWYGKVNFLKGGLTFADFVTTVSPTQARELRTPGGGFGLHDLFQSLGDRLVGVLNGIDQQTWNPATDSQITAPLTVPDSGETR